jgi:hypothetical protein
LDAAIGMRPRMEAFLKQRVDEPSTPEEADAYLLALADELTRRIPVTGEVIDGPPAPGAAGVPGRQVPAGGVSGPPAIPSLQLTA